MPAAYKLRLSTKGDENSFYSDWLRSGRKSRTYAGIKSQVYFFWQHLVVEGLMQDAGVTWIVACASNDPTKIYGWLCGQRADTLAGDQAIVHFLYVKKLYRRVGIASALLDNFAGSAPALVVTTLTEPGKALLGDRTFVFNPYLQFARTPQEVPKLRRNHPVRVSRRLLAEGGFDPNDEGEDV